jgi:uncharacterized glyoxalase superfamily protein PhnB
MEAHAPVLLVRDVPRAHRYYASALGFGAPRMWGEPPTFCIVRRDGLELMLSQVDAGDAFRTNGSYGHRIDAYFWVSDVDALHAEFTEKGAEVTSAPEDRFYGCREFEVRDPDGHVLCFGQETGKAN